MASKELNNVQRTVNEDALKTKALEGILQRVKFAVHLPLETRTELSKHLVSAKHSTDHVIFREGDQGDEFYILVEGTVKVSVLHQSTHQERVVAYLKPGDTFGELALTDPKCRRKATIICVSDCHLLTLGRETYLNTIQNELDRETLQKLTFLRQVVLFEGLSGADLIKLAEMLVTKHFASEKIVSRQGNDVEDILFVLHGAIKGVRGVDLVAIRSNGAPHERKLITRDPASNQKTRTLPRRRGALTLGMTPDAQTRIVPALPHAKKQTTGPQTTKLASLLSKHRRQLIGKAPIQPSPVGIFDVTMAALRATKRQRDRELQEQDINKFNISSAVYKDDWVFIEVFEGGKFDCVGDCSIVKVSRQNMTVFTTTPTIFYSINKFEMLKRLTESALNVINANASPEIDEKTLIRNYKTQKQWKLYKRRVTSRIMQESKLQRTLPKL